MSRRLPPLRPLPDAPPAGREVEAELAFHFEEAIEALERDGWSPPQARTEAERRFGDRLRYRRDLTRIDGANARRRGRTLMWDVMRQNVRDAVRGLRRAPGAALAIVLLLGLGIGANATMFDIVDRLLLRPPDHLVHADRLRLIYAQRPTLSLSQFARNLTYPDVDDIRHLPAFEAVSAFTQTREMTLGAGREAQKVRAALAEASFFTTLGVQPRLGRFYVAREDDIGAAQTAVISEAFWEANFGRDPHILGRVLPIEKGRYQIVGVAPRGFTGADLSAVDVWLPLRTTMAVESRPDSLKTRTWWWATAVVRLKPGVSDEAASAQMTTAHVTARREVERQGGEPYLSKGPAYLYTASMIAARRPNPSKTASISLSLAIVSLIVLLVACANVANLLLARGIQLRRELAVRVALGAEKRRLVALVLTEAAVLAAAGAAASLVVARWSGALARSYLPDITFPTSVFGARLLVFNLIAASVTVLLAGLLPALQAARTTASEALRGSSRGASAARSRLRDGLMIGQTALSVVLLVGAGLFVQSLYRAAHADVGFDRDHVLVATIEGQPDLTREQRDELYFTALERVRAMPGVQRAALSIESTVAFGGWSGPGGITTPGGKVIDDLPDGGPFLYSGTEGFFETLGVPIVKGRSFTAAEYVDGSEPVGMVSETFVRQVWPDRDPIGQCFVMAASLIGRVPPQPCRRVVGVFSDFARQGLADKGTIAVAIPNRPGRKSPQMLVARTDGDPAATAVLIRQMMSGLSTEIRFVRVDTMADRVDELLEPWKLGATMFVVFGGLALTVAGVGLYSLLAFGVAARRRELGIRAALGARRAHLVAMVMRQAGVLLVAGVVVGGALALAAGRFVREQLFDSQAPADPGVYAAVLLVLLVAGALASAVPAWRATTVSPTTVMREE